MRTIAIINQKGGCGKTTTAINLSATLARQNQRTLLVDMDPQSHCAAGLGIPEQRIELDIGDAMLAAGHRHIDPARLLWRAVRNLDLAPSRMRLAGLEAPRGGLADHPEKEKRLSAVLAQFKGAYDIVCIDCPPSIGLLTYNALAAADLILIPVETSYFALQGATKQVNTVKTMSRRLGVQLPVWILPTIHDHTNAVAADLLEELHRRFKDKVMPLVIRRDPKLREAASFGQSVVDYAPESAGAEDYLRLAVWALENLKPRTAPPPESLGAVIELLPHEAPPPPLEPEPLAAEDEPLAAPPAPAPEVKQVSRAEDVARRAQEFLRRVALGRANLGESAGLSQLSSPIPAPAAQIEPQPSQPIRSGTVLKLIEAPAPTPVDPSAQRILGVRETSQGVLFVQPLTLGNRIAIAGNFNNWSDTDHPMAANHDLGVWELCLKLPPGKLLYRLVIDGQWCTDPYNENCEPNPFGQTNSSVTVGQAAVATGAD